VREYRRKSKELKRKFLFLISIALDRWRNTEAVGNLPLKIQFGSAFGKTTKHFVPFPETGSKVTLPRFLRAIILAMGRPKPVPVGFEE